MGKSLVIVESPAKAKTINKYLGAEFVVKSSVGHVRDLPVSGGANKVDPKQRAQEAAKTRKLSPEDKVKFKAIKAKKALVERMGIDPEHDWAADYEILPGKQKVVDELSRLAAKADQIYLATDLDREGEAIAWHLKEVIGGDDARFKRVVFNEITKTAIQEAFQSPGELNLNRVNAQQARRFLDRVVGYMVSPLLWAKIARGLSAGRVQSVAVRILVEREREIRAFVPEEFWEVFAQTATDNDENLRLQVVKKAGVNFRPTSKTQCDAELSELKAQPLHVLSREDKPTQSRPGAPFITSTLQQAASTRLGFGVKKTMALAQRLYEAGYITYMRTDSTNLSAEAIRACRDMVLERYGNDYLPKEPIQYSSKASAQEAHEAIRPTDVTVSSTQLANMERDAERLYELIWRRFVACQMAPARFLSTSIVVKSGDFELRARGRILQFDGFLRVLPLMGKSNEEEVVLPDVKTGANLSLLELLPKQHFTKPPPRFSEASLVKELEKRGIGRPSTYASIISTIQDRGYAKLDRRRFYAEKIGEIVTDRLIENFGNLLEYSFTASMEEQLDEVSQGSKMWKSVLNEFYADFSSKLDRASQQDGMRANVPVAIDLPCPSCERDMQIRNASTGVFLGCSGYALPPKERCKTTINLLPGDEAEAVAGNGDCEEVEVEELRAKQRCPLCQTAMEAYLIDESRKLHICGNNPDCEGYHIEHGAFKIKGYDGPVIECDKCQSEMQLKSGRFGKYFGCTNTECKNTRKLLRNGEVAPPKEDPIPMPHLRCEKSDDFFLLRDGASGIFLAASQFPKHRESRAPTVEEVLSVKDQLPEKFAYLAEAPVRDGNGNPSIIRYSRKTKEQYVMSEVEGKASGWAAYYDQGKWVAQEKQTREKQTKEKQTKEKQTKEKQTKEKQDKVKPKAKKAAVSSSKQNAKSKTQPSTDT
ncbi:MAG: type I DNA topoisomerase [Gammaproteobacteria bacterium]